MPDNLRIDANIDPVRLRDLKIPQMLADIEINKLDPDAIRKLKFRTRMPVATPIERMGLSKKGIELLTPAAKSLTKADLIDLEMGTVSSPAGKKLTVKDVASIQQAFGKHYSPIDNVAEIDVSCCCCTPCCCAVAA